MLLTSSCVDFLEEKAYSFISGDDLYTTESGIKLALEGLYGTINLSGTQGQSIAMWGKSMQYMTCMGTDELINHNVYYGAEPSFAALATYDYNYEKDIFSFMWFGHFLGIDRANNILANINKVEMDANTRKQIVAETKFLRGFFQFYLTFMYGGVPAPRQPMEAADAPRLPLEKVYGYVIEDLRDAYNDLPKRNAVEGRANKYAAAAYLSKVYLYLASCKHYNVGKDFPDLEINSFDWVDVDKMYADAEILVKEIYDNSNYKLITPYKYLFYSSTEAEAREESIFTVMCSPGSTNYLSIMRLWAPAGGGYAYGWGRPLNELVSKYRNVDPRYKHNITGNLNNKPKTEMVNGVSYPVPNAVNAERKNECLGKIRWNTKEENVGYGIPEWASIYDWPLIRFADIVLMYAELKLHNGDEQGARDLLHEIRLRAAKDATYPVKIANEVFNTADALAVKLDEFYFKNDCLTEILDERSRELCGEGWRRYDLIRTNQLEKTVVSINTNNKQFYWNTQLGIAKIMKDNFRKYKIWYPLPKRELEINKNLMQNYGYSGEEQ